MGTNTLVGHDSQKLAVELSAILEGRAKRGSIPPLWDGQAGERIADVIQKL
jgi:UDP-N-acetylglucosamine 2-epimerase (non-hydrolysing)